ncbi:hypothetical protein ABK040_009635 [Willaertia magna]
MSVNEEKTKGHQKMNSTIDSVATTTRLNATSANALKEEEEFNDSSEQQQQYNKQQKHSGEEHGNLIFKNSTFELVKHFSKECFAGSLGGMSGIIVGHPLDTIRVRLQTLRPKGVSAFGMLRQTVMNEGSRALFKGMLSPLIGETLNNCVLFGVYNGLIPSLWKSHEHSITTQFLSGSLAGFCIAFIVCPTELIKIRLQTQFGQNYGFFNKARHIWRNEGKLIGIYHGFSATMLRELSFNGVYFASYEQAKEFLYKHQKSIFGSRIANNEEEELIPKSNWKIVMTSGGFAGVTAWLLTYPTDVIKSAVQARSPLDKHKVALKVKDVFKEALKSRSLFVGLGPTLVRAVPSNAVTFWMYELVSSYLHK